METVQSDPESPCLDKLQREALLCLNTFPDKVMELNNLIDIYTPEAIKKSRGKGIKHPAPSCLSIISTTRDYYFHDADSCCSGTTWDRCKSRNGISKKKYRVGYGGPSLRRRSRPLAHILAILVNRLSACTQTVVIKPSMYILDCIAAMFLHRENVRQIQAGTSTVWSNLNSKGNSTVVNVLSATMRPAAVRLIADTTITRFLTNPQLKRWLQALALASTPPNPSLAQAIRTTETIDGWAYELFFHLKYLQVINFPTDMRYTENSPNVTKIPEKDLVTGAEPGNTIFSGIGLDSNAPDDLMHTNLWHRIVQLRDHYVILYETLRSNDKLTEPVAPK